MFNVPDLLFGLLIVGAIGGGFLAERIGDVRLAYAAIGALIFAIAFAFRVASPLGHAERYLRTDTR